MTYLTNWFFRWLLQERRITSPRTSYFFITQHDTSPPTAILESHRSCYIILSCSPTISTSVCKAVRMDLSHFVNLRPGAASYRYKCICGESFKSYKQRNQHTSRCNIVKLKARSMMKKYQIATADTSMDPCAVTVSSVLYSILLPWNSSCGVSSYRMPALLPQLKGNQSKRVRGPMYA